MSTPSAKFLPQGWTEERLANATDEDWDTLTDDDWLRLRDRWANETLQAIEESKAQSGEQPSSNVQLAPFVEAIQKEHISGDWGFVVFRTTYGNDDEWTQLRQQWDQLNQRELTPEYGEGITDDVKERLKFKWVEDEAALVDADPESVRRYFHDMLESDDTPAGLAWPIVLLVSKESLLSIIHSNAESTKPFAIAVDIEYYPEEYDEDYQGYFRVAVGTLLNELFPLMARGILPPNEIAATLDSDNDVWTGIGS